MYWIEGSKPTWHLGIIDNVEENSCLVSHLVRKSVDGCLWAFPAEADTWSVFPEQILAKNICVEYTQSVNGLIKCRISRELVEKLDSELKNY